MVVLIAGASVALAAADHVDPNGYWTSVFVLGVTVAFLIGIGSWANSLGKPRKVEQTDITGREEGDEDE
jgi:hypothetical protein